MAHSLVTPRLGAERPTGTELHQRIFDLCLHAGRRVAVVELAAALNTTPGLTSVIVSDLIGNGHLVLHRSKRGRNASRGHAHIERLVAFLRDQPLIYADTVKIVVVGERGHGVTSFLSHLLSTPLDVAPTPEGPGRTLECAMATVDSDLYLAAFGVQGADHLQAQWPDLMRETDGVIVLARSDRLAEALDTTWMLSQGETPYLIAVNLVDDDVDLTADQVRTTLEADAHIPVVMVDAREKPSVMTTITDLCTWTLKQQEEDR